MRTADEMADFIVEKVLDTSTLEEGQIAEYKMQLRLDFTNMFPLIEQALEDEDVLYVIPSASVASTQCPLGKHNEDLPVVTIMFTTNRCILIYTDSPGKKMFRTIPYDEINSITAKPAPQKLLNGSWGELIVSTTTDTLRFRTWYRRYKRDWIYVQFVPERACEAVTELVIKYKQAKYAAQPAPQAAPQAPTVSQAAPAAPSAGAGLPAETVEALKQLKDLLDAGILTQEEFDAKKKQLLGL